MPRVELDTLVAPAVAGDRRALRQLCERLSGPVFRHALRMLGSVADAQDATQEILLQVITRLSTFEGRSGLLTWVYTLASRHLVRARRTHAEETARSIEATADAIDAGLALTAANEHATGEERVLEREVQLACTQGMLLALSREERLAYILGHVLGTSDRLGATICEVSPAAFRQRLARARKTMEPLLAERCGLAHAPAPCTCSRQVVALRRAGLSRPLAFATLPNDEQARVERADVQLGLLRKSANPFELEPPPGPPVELWARLVEALPDLLG